MHTDLNPGSPEQPSTARPWHCLPSGGVIRHPDVEDYFVEMGEGGTAEEYWARYGNQAAQHYEDGKVLIFRNFALDPEALKFLQTVEYPRGREFQKLTSSSILKPLPGVAASPSLARRAVRTAKGIVKRALGRPPKLPAPHVLDTIFQNDRDKATRFQECVGSIDSQVWHFIRTLFPQYKFTPASKITWRFSETAVEELHLDYFKRYDSYWKLRFFINLDSVPRIWNTSHNLETLAERYYRKTGMAEFRNAHADDFNRFFTRRVFQTRESAGLDGFPRHLVHFPPSTFWMAHSQLISHQIFYGRRMLSGMFDVEPDSMLDPSKNFVERVRRIHEKFGADN